MDRFPTFFYCSLFLLISLRSATVLTTGKTIGGREVIVMQGEEVASWQTAYERCRSLGMQLIVISSQEEDDQVLKLMLEIKLKETWLGANMLGRDSFVWIATGKQLDYTNWDAGEPNRIGANEKCLIRYDRLQSWNDIDCNPKRAFICQETAVDFLRKATQRKNAELEAQRSNEQQKLKEQYDVLVEKNRNVEKSLTDLVAEKQALAINLKDTISKNEESLQKIIDMAFDLKESQKELARVAGELKELKANHGRCVDEHRKLEIEKTHLIARSEVNKDQVGDYGRSHLLVMGFLGLFVAATGGLLIALIVVTQSQRKSLNQIELSRTTTAAV